MRKNNLEIYCLIIIIVYRYIYMYMYKNFGINIGQQDVLELFESENTFWVGHFPVSNIDSERKFNS